MSQEDRNTEPGERILIDAVDRLGEHYDSVRVFVNYVENGETRSRTVGRGNFCGQLGQIFEWVELQRQHQRNTAIRRDQES